MLIRPSTAFAHPVLSPHTDDYGDRLFDIELEVEEVPGAGEVVLKGQFTLDDPSVEKLIYSNLANVSIVVESLETYFQKFVPISEANFRLDFTGGELRGRVAIQAVVAAVRDVLLHSEHIASEYPAHTRKIQSGEVIAASSIHWFQAGLDKLVPMESIFRLVANDDVRDGLFLVGLDSEAIQIEVDRRLYDTIYGIRGTSMRDLLLPSLFLPAVMNALDVMRTPGSESMRWHRVIAARCGSEGITLDQSTDLASAAQQLLEGPLGLLHTLFNEEDK